MPYIKGKVTACRKLPSKPVASVSFKASRRYVTSYCTLFEKKMIQLSACYYDSNMVMFTSLESLQTAGSFLRKQFSQKPVISALFWKVKMT